jgi:hypothetical protein
LGQGQKPEGASGEARGRGGLGALRANPVSITLKAEIAAVLESSNIGTHARILDDNGVIQLLKAAVEREGSITAFAARHRLSRTDLNNILNGKDS